MKTKRRHELQTNELADWLGNKIEAVKPYSQFILAGVIAAFAIIGLIFYSINQQNQTRANAWGEYMVTVTEENPGKMMKVAGNHADSQVGLWATQAASDIYLREGITELYKDRETGLDSIEKAKQGYETVVNDARVDRMLLERAQYGLALAQECLGDVEEARKNYEKVVASAGADSALGKLAAKQVARTNQSSAKSFYEQFANYEQPVPVSPEPGGQMADPLARFPDLPDRPDLTFPGGGDLFDDDTSSEPGATDDGSKATDDDTSDPKTGDDDKKDDATKGDAKEKSDDKSDSGKSSKADSSDDAATSKDGAAPKGDGATSKK